MAENGNAAQLSDEPQTAQVISAAVDVHPSDGDEDFRVLSGIVREFPSHAVKDLLSCGVCSQCILRLFGIREHLSYWCSLSPSVLSSVLGDLIESEKHMIKDVVEENGSFPTSKESEDPVLCSICLGILQFIYSDGKVSLVRKDSSNDFAASIVVLVKQEGYQIEDFSLEVSIPPAIQENERFLWSYMRRKYGNEPWFQRKSSSECISVKDAIKISITKPLETKLACKSNISNFRIRLTYSHPKASEMVQSFLEQNNGCKRRKTGIGNNSEIVDNNINYADFSTTKADAADGNNLETFKSPTEKVSEPCRLLFQCHRTQIYFGGRYLKYSRNVSQSCWIIDDERMGDASVEELIGSNILPFCHGDNYKFHAAGREDIDVRMLGSGRPFLVEIQNPRCVPCEESVKDMEKKINTLENKLVGVKNLKMVGSQGWTLMREGEAEKQKQYVALVWISRPLKDEDFQSITSLKDMPIQQKTPVRVLHRRSPLERERIIHWMRIEKISGSSQYFLLHLCTQAGTYIKEFVHGDLGRTNPSIGSMLGCRAEILQLDVTDVKMDCFLNEQVL
ncbi:hypothetical protein UlMin_033992 [Ulmus minor]